MKPSIGNLFLTAFGLCALVAMTNVACSAPTDVDSGTSEAIAGKGAYSTGGSYGGVGSYGVSYGYAAFASDLANDSAP